MALRKGYTTGSTAAAAAIAASCLCQDMPVPEVVRPPLPPLSVEKEIPEIEIEKLGRLAGGGFYAEARKDGGDDPDVTNGMVIRASIYPNSENRIEIEGGLGIGRVTLPGLPVPVGMAAINPAPRSQILEGIRSAGLGRGLLVLSAIEGEERAKATMNSRLGIVGGISILGTQGIVQPYSNKAWLASIHEALNVSRALGLSEIWLVTGRRSARYAAEQRTDLCEQNIVIAGDMAKAALAAASDFSVLRWGCFIGKLIKLAQGFANTHANECALDFAWLADIIGLPALAECVTASQALGVMLKNSPSGIAKLLRLAKHTATFFAGREVIIHLFSASGREIGRA